MKILVNNSTDFSENFAKKSANFANFATKINFAELDSAQEISRGANILVLENRAIFAKYAFDLAQENFANFRIFDENFEDEKNILVISDFLSFNFSAPKFQKKLYEILAQNFAFYENRDDFAKEFYEFQKKLNEFLFAENDLEISSENEFDFQKILKFFDVKINVSTAENAFAQMSLLLEILPKILPKTVVVFVGALAFFSRDEISEIAKQTNCSGITVLFVENLLENVADANILRLDEDLFFTREMI